MYYKLEEKAPVPCSVEEFETNASKRRVAYDASDDGTLTVSTVFLGIDHGSDGEILLFESMVFEGDESVRMERYPTWADAEKGHADLVAEFLPIEVTE